MKFRGCPHFRTARPLPRCHRQSTSTGAVAPPLRLQPWRITSLACWMPRPRAGETQIVLCFSFQRKNGKRGVCRVACSRTLTPRRLDLSLLALVVPGEMQWRYSIGFTRSLFPHSRPPRVGFVLIMRQRVLPVWIARSFSREHCSPTQELYVWPTAWRGRGCRNKEPMAVVVSYAYVRLRDQPLEQLAANLSFHLGRVSNCGR